MCSAGQTEQNGKNRMDERLEVEKCRESANDGGDEGGRERG